MNADTGTTPLAGGLEALEARLAHDLELLNYPPADWVTPRTRRSDDPARLVDVLIVGAGMCGLTAAFALRRAGIGSLAVVDASEPGREGPWVTYARMRTLRSPKHLTGPAQGLPSLTFRAWFEAQFGTAAWEALGRIPRTQWMDYLRWFRRVLGIAVENRTRVVSIEPAGSGFRVATESDDGTRATVGARKVVLATGREGLAVPRIPPSLRRFLGGPVQHSSEAVDFAALAGRRVAVLGLAASAMDNAGTALEAGAERVWMLARTARIPRINKAKGLVYTGFVEGFPGLDDRSRFEWLAYVVRCGLPPPRDSVLRVSRHPGFELRLGCEVTAARPAGERLRLTTSRGDLDVDRVLLGTGFRIDVDAAPELRGFAAEIARWRDRIEVQDEPATAEFLDFPYLGRGFAFTERHPGAAPFLANLHCFNFAAWLSHGYVSSDIPAISEGGQRLARAIARDFFAADVAQHLGSLRRFDDPELLGDEVDVDAWWPPLDA